MLNYTLLNSETRVLENFRRLSYVWFQAQKPHPFCLTEIYAFLNNAYDNDKLFMLPGFYGQRRGWVQEEVNEIYFVLPFQMNQTRVSFRYLSFAFYERKSSFDK